MYFLFYKYLIKSLLRVKLDKKLTLQYKCILLTIQFNIKQKESLENIFKHNKSVVETQITKLPVKILNPYGDVLNNQNQLASSAHSYLSVQKNNFESSRQNLIPVDLKGSQDPNLKYQNINTNAAFLSQKLQEREDQLHNIQKETEKYNQNIKSISVNNSNSHNGQHTKGNGGKASTIKGVAIGIAAAVLFTIFSNLFNSNVEGINPLNL